MSWLYLRFCALFCVALSVHADIPIGLTLVSSPNPSVFGQPVILTATPNGSPGGVITFYDGTTVLGSAPYYLGPAKLTTVLLAAGSHSFKAYYAGDVSSGPKMSTVVQHTVTAVGGGGFSTRILHTGDGNQTSLAIGDFNGDKKADLVVGTFPSSFTLLLGNGNGGFIEHDNIAEYSGYRPSGTAVGDFNKDGIMDLAVTDGVGSVYVLIGLTNGSFRSSAITVGMQPESIVAADFNGDGNTDLAVANVTSNNVTVLLGNAFGGFPTASTLTAGQYPTSLAVGDFDGDGIADLAVGDSTSSVTIFLGNGAGGFIRTSGSPVATGSTSSCHLLRGDFNGDGKADLAVVSYGSNNVTILLGDGRGGFSASSGGPFPTGPAPTSIASGDFNGDGIADLAVVNSGSDNVSVLLGNGNGSFAPLSGSPFAAGSGSGTVVVGDFNGDGMADLAVLNGVGNVAVLTGGFSTATTTTLTPLNPSTFGTMVTLTATVSPAATGIVTFYDGATVLGSAPLVGGRAQLSTPLLEAGSRTLRAYYEDAAPYLASVSAPVIQTVNARPGVAFTNAATITAGASPYAVAVGDFNGDGKADLVTANYGSNNVSVWLGNGSGGYAPAGGSPIAVGFGPQHLVVADFNSDGKADLAVANFGGNSVTVLLGNGSGGFTPAVGSPFTVGAGPNFLAVADFNVDGKADLLVSCQGTGFVTLLLGDGSGGFPASPEILFPSGHLTVGDFNNDRIADFAIASATISNLYSVDAFVGDGFGGFTGALSPQVTGGQAITTGDFNGDGRADLAVAGNNGTLSVLLGTGNWGFIQVPFVPAPGSPLALGATATAIVAGDFNGDGMLDLAVTNTTAGTVTVLLGNGIGGFAVGNGSPLAVGSGPMSLAVGDFNGDGIADLAVANSGSNNVTILLGSGQAVAPSAISVSAATANGAYGSTAAIALQVAFSSQVTVTGTPLLALNSGASASYSSGSGSATLTFIYNVAAGQNISRLDYPSTSAITLNGGAITGAGGLPATFTLPAPGGAGSLGANSNIAIDTTPPTVTNVTSSTANGTYVAASVVSIQVSFSKPVNVTGAPSLALTSGGTAIYASGSGSGILTFTYTVGIGENSAHLDYTSSGALTLNGGTIKDTVSPPNAGNLALAAPGTAGSLGANTNLKISGVVYSIQGQVTLSGAGLSGVTMTLSGSQGATTMTDGSGNYSFSGLVTGNYTMTPFRSAYTFLPPSATFNALNADQTANFAAQVPQIAIQLKFSTPPTVGTTGVPLTPVVVQVRDGGNNLVPTASASVRLVSSPAAVDVTVQAVNGVAAFNSLVFNSAGTYTFTASSTGLTSAISGSYSIAATPSAAPSVAIDSPTTGTVVSTGSVIVSGWALDNTTAAGTAISSVQVKVDGIPIGNAAYGSSRPDVCAAYPGRAGCPNVGYIYSVSLALLSPGSHTVTVSATDSDATPNVGSASVNITVAALVMASTKVGVFRAGSQFLQDTNGNATVDGPDRFLTTFAPPGGVVTGDLAVVGDWNGDGHAKAGFYRPSEGKWWLDANNNGSFDAGDLSYSFGGLAGDLPFVGDWNAVAGVSVNKTCIGIYRANGSVWLLDLNCNGTFDNTPTDAFFPFGGLPGDLPVAGNWTGTQTRVGVVRKYAPAGVPQGEPFFWVLDGGSATAGNAPLNHPAAPGAFAFGGLAGDQFVSGDWLGAGTARAGVYRAGLWVLDANGLHNPDLIISYGGVATDKAVTGTW